jgi:thiamine-phosphate pyrophosphorylase
MLDKDQIREAMCLYAVTDRSFCINESLADQVIKAIEGGITLLQLREKDISEEEFLKEALQIKEIMKQYHIPLIINDNLAIAIRSNADGLHIGQSDGSPEEIKALLGDNKILGVSVASVEEALLAQAKGADYLGVGAIFQTTTKLDANPVTLNILQEICKAVSIPVVAIGGIQENNIGQLAGSGVDGVAVVSAIFGQQDIIAVTRKLKTLVKDVLKDAQKGRKD